MDNLIFDTDDLNSFLSSSEFYNTDEDIGTEEPKKQKNKKTSDSLAKNAKQFLHENNIRENIFNKPSFQILKNVLTDLRLPIPGEQIRIRTQQQINLISIVLKLIKTHKTIDELTIATYTLNRISMDTIIPLVEAKKIKKLNLMISSSYGFRDKKYFEELKENWFDLGQKFDVHLTFAWSHLKITLAKCGNNFYQIEGSMNYSTNNQAEQLFFENNSETYHHDYNFIIGIMLEKENKALEIII